MIFRAFVCVLLLVSQLSFADQTFFLGRYNDYADPIGISIWRDSNGRLDYNGGIVVTALNVPLKKNIYLSFDLPSDVMPPWTDSEFIGSWVNNDRMVVARYGKTLAFLDTNCSIQGADGLLLGRCESVDGGRGSIFYNANGQVVVHVKKMKVTGHDTVEWQIVLSSAAEDTFKAVALIYVAGKISEAKLTLAPTVPTAPSMISSTGGVLIVVGATLAFLAIAGLARYLHPQET